MVFAYLPSCESSWLVSLGTIRGPSGAPAKQRQGRNGGGARAAQAKAPRARPAPPRRGRLRGSSTRQAAVDASTSRGKYVYASSRRPIRCGSGQSGIARVHRCVHGALQEPAAVVVGRAARGARLDAARTCSRTRVNETVMREHTVIPIRWHRSSKTRRGHRRVCGRRPKPRRPAQQDAEQAGVRAQILVGREQAIREVEGQDEDISRLKKRSPRKRTDLFRPYAVRPPVDRAAVAVGTLRGRDSRSAPGRIGGLRITSRLATDDHDGRVSHLSPIRAGVRREGLKSIASRFDKLTSSTRAQCRPITS